MVQDENVSIDPELTPENQDRYGDYYKMNPVETVEAGTEAEEVDTEVVESSGEETETEVDTQIRPVETDEAEVKPTESKVTDVEPTSKGKGKSGYQRSIDRLTRQRNEEREVVAELKKRLKDLEDAKPEPQKKLKPDNFLTNEEYIEAVADQRANALLDDRAKQEDIRAINQEIQATEHRVFSENWNEKVNDSFPVAEDKQAFNELVKKHGDLGLPKDVHDYLDYSEDGPKLYTVLALRPDVLHNIKSKAESVRGMILRDLEKVINQAPVSSPETSQTTKAPDPIGSVQNTGSSGSAMTDKDRIQAYYKGKYGS